MVFFGRTKLQIKFNKSVAVKIKSFLSLKVSPAAYSNDESTEMDLRLLVIIVVNAPVGLCLCLCLNLMWCVRM